MGSHDLARINRISYDTVLAKGQAIIVYQVADPNRSKRADEQWRKTPRARRGKLTGTRAARTASTNVPVEEAAADSETNAASDEPAAEAPDSPTPQADARQSSGDAKRTEVRSAEAKKPDAQSDARRAKPRSEAEDESMPASERDGEAGDAEDDVGPVTKPTQLR